MWIFFSDSYLSIVADADNPENYYVRARFVNDIEKVFPKYKATETLGRDYRFRASIPADEVVKAITDRASKIDYTNFKDSTTSDLRHDIYLAVWTVLYNWQNRLLPKKKKAEREKTLLDSDSWRDYLNKRYPV